MTPRAVPRLLISAAHKSSGKTAVTIGLAAALTAQGRVVQTFKKGPDFIDPLWHKAASGGRDCWNLDPNTQGDDDIAGLFERASRGADIAVIEGNKGLFDGIDLDGGGSTAAVAETLGAPVILVVDTRGMTRGIAPLLLGYVAFGQGLRIGGVILNMVGGPRHEGKLRAAIAHYTDLPVLGALQRDPALAISERHLGLIPANEAVEAMAAIGRLGEAVAAGIDLDAVIRLAATAAPIQVWDDPATLDPLGRLRIGIARGPAFGFYYPDDIEGLRAAGAELVELDPLRDTGVPGDLDAMFIGGGFPETHAHALEANQGFRAGLARLAQAGLPIYAECGGLMYLSQAITWNGERRRMAGVIPGETVMEERPQGRGLVRLKATAAHPWGPADREVVIPAHEFHHSRLIGLEGDLAFGYEVLRGAGIAGNHDGLVWRNTLANYAHLRGVGPDPWPRRFAAFALQVRNARTGA